MLDMGFSEALEKILSSVPVERKMLMFSATMSKEISAIAKKYLYNPQEIVIGSRNEGSENVNHVYYMVHAKDKYLALKRIVDYYPHIYAIIFCRTRLETQEVADKLMQDGYNADSLHGELSQAQRDLTMNKFRKRQLQLLVATDVAARGLDVDNLTHVINYGLPDDTENYTHRSGRTGRAGKKGTSIAIINLREKGKIRFIEKAIGKKFNIGEMPTGRQICEKQLYKVIDDIERTQVDEEQIEKFLPDIFRRLDWMDKEDIVKRIVTMEFGRFMRYYKDAPELEAVNVKSAEKAEKEEKKRKERQPQAGYTRFFINLGKLDNIIAVHIIDHINKHIKERIDIGRIDIKHSFSFFEAPNDCTDLILSSLNNTRLRNREIHVEVAESSAQNQNGKTQKKADRKEQRKDSKKGASKENNRKERNSSSKSQKVSRAPQNQFGDFVDEFEDFDITTAKPKKGSRSKKQSDHWQKEFNRNDWKQFFGEPEKKSRRGAGRNGNQNSGKKRSRR
jgi:ATP-dependent RNA helicase DeaD